MDGAKAVEGSFSDFDKENNERNQESSKKKPGSWKLDDFEIGLLCPLIFIYQYIYIYPS